MTLHSLSLVLLLSFGAHEPLHASLDVYPTFYMPANLPDSRPGLSLPHLMFVDERAITALNQDWRSLGYQQMPLTPDHEPFTIRGMRMHEYGHIRQWEALGPSFAALYLVTGGVPFEDYMGDYMWLPEEDVRYCPMFRISMSGSSPGVSFMPCWRFGN